MPRPKHPHIVKRTLGHLRGVRFVVDLGMVDGKRVEKFFKKRSDAETFLDEQKDKLRKHGHSAVALTEADRIVFQAERDRLARAGATITTAVDFYLEHHRPLKEPPSLARLLDLAVLDKELAGARPRYMTQFRSSCRSFILGREERLAHTVTRDEVKGWILGKGFAPKTQRTYLGDLRTLFAWGVTERFLSKNPIAGKEGFIELAAEEEGEIAVFDVAQCSALLFAALFATYETRTRNEKGRWDRREVAGGLRELIGYLALAMFAGVRPDEIKRAEIERLELTEGTVVIRGRDAKTRQRRVIKLERTGLIWLRLWRRLCPTVTAFAPKNFDRKLKALRAKAKTGAWPNDVLRHTFASYHYALHENRARLQAVMGHTEDEDTLDRHYRGVQTLAGKTITAKLAREFWALTPRKVRVSATPSF